jgi:transcriptional regulator with XRE-family HTH domain
MNIAEAIREVAEQEGISEAEVLNEIGVAIDAAWYGGTRLIYETFPEGKPDPITFLERIAKILR